MMPQIPLAIGPRGADRAVGHETHAPDQHHVEHAELLHLRPKRDRVAAGCATQRPSARTP